MLLGELDLTAAEMDVRERGDDAARVALVPDVERGPEGVFQEDDGFVGLPEQEVQTAEVVE